MSEKLSEKRNVSAVCEAQECVRAIAGAEPGDTVMRQIGRASRRISFWRWSRVKDAWYGEQRMRIGADELSALRQLAKKYSGGKEIESVDIDELRGRIRRIEEALRLSDPDAYRALVGKSGATAD